ncbi:hypothetical protein [Mucilaginibacter arboris]|uniref:Uncharacterized protein n=1 Tax=Mucilaginibacter arboris TaxID=2682090 RepID=A0A7K1SVK7_9SPHI|nr:hypothetical protein [Mucilaginibacter arboris]MVN21355.1 hypothetical protein [Mucilaginibacter arboris]
MRVILENFNEKHIGLLKEMADILKFRFTKLDHSSPEVLPAYPAISESEEKEMTLFAMQASEQSMANVWDKEEDDYWNSYL